MRRNAIVLALAVITFSSAQCQQVQWATSGGTWVDDAASKVVVDKTGNVYTTGHIGTFGNFFGTSVDEWGYYLLKQNKAGVVKWIRFSKSSYDARGEGLAVDSKGNVYVAGSYHYTMDLGDTTLVGAAQGPLATLFFIKYDSLGNRKWARTIGPDGQVGGPLLAIDQQDNVYLASSYVGSVTLGGGLQVTSQHQTYYGSFDVFLSRWSGSGHPNWGISFSASGDDRLTGLQAGPDGNIHLLAQNSSGDLLVGSTKYTLKNSTGSYLASSSSAGTISKVMSLDFGGADLAVSDIGEFYVSGVNPSLISYITKVRSDYALEWTKPIKNTNNPGTPIKVALSGSDVYVGTSYGGQVMIDSTTVSGTHGLIVAKFSGIGVLQWIKNYAGGASSYTTMSSLTSVGVGQIILAGTYSEPTYDFDGKTITNNSGNNDVDVFVAFLKDPTTNFCPSSNPRVSTARPSFCRGDSLKISTNAGAGYYRMAWYSGNQFLQYTGDFYAKENGSYHCVRYPGSACEQTSNSVNLSVIELAPKSISPGDTNTCDSQVAINVTKDAQYTYQWYKDTNIISGQTASTLMANQNGTYYCSILKLGLCTTKTDQTKIQLFTAPTFTVVASPVNSTSTRFFASDSRFITSYQWTVAGTTLKSTLSSPIFTFSTTGTYQVCLLASNPGCSATFCSDYSITITGMEELASAAVSAYPNPFAKSFVISSENCEEFSVSIFDISGSVIQSVTCRESFQFDTSTWAAGTYMARIFKDGAYSTIRVVKN